MTDTPSAKEKNAYLVFTYLDFKNKPKLVTRGFNHRLHSHLPGKCLEISVDGVIVSSDATAVGKHEGNGYEDTPEGRARMEKDMNGEFIRFDRHQQSYAELILEAVKMGAPVRVY